MSTHLDADAGGGRDARASMPSTAKEPWPEIRLADWRDTYATLHMWTQIVGKTRLALAPPENHWWHVPLYVSARGLITGPMPGRSRSLDVEFDFIDHRLVMRTSDGGLETLPLEPQSVATFYRRYLDALRRLGFEAQIWPVPVEVEHTIPFGEDEQHASYEPEDAYRIWRILSLVEDVFKRFKGDYLGKCSPVHFFWGSFDLAVTRFSGRRAPVRPDADPVTREAYSHEVISGGFWPGSGPIEEASFYAYAAPEPAGFRDATVQPEAAYYHSALGEFLLPYEAVRTAPSPSAMLLSFLQSAYDAAATLGGWDREALERPASQPLPRNR